MLRRTAQKLGFTIVEILIVIVVVGILAGIGVVAWSGVTNRAFNTNIVNSMTAYKAAFELYAQREGSYPPVPSPGNYCLQTSAFSAGEANTIDPGANLPTTITGGGVSAPAYYCREIAWQPMRHAGYPPLNKALATIAQVNDTPDAARRMQVNDVSGGVFVEYRMPDGQTPPTASNPTAQTALIIKGMVRGRDCPAGVEREWTSPDSMGAARSICHYIISKAYPVTYTMEPWDYLGTADD